jgi:hypothetical protein
LRTQFIWRDLAIAVLVELLQRLGSILDFRRGNDSIAIGIERGDQGRHGAAFAPASAFGTTLRATTFAGRRFLLIVRGGFRESSTEAK